MKFSRQNRLAKSYQPIQVQFQIFSSLSRLNHFVLISHSGKLIEFNVYSFFSATRSRAFRSLTWQVLAEPPIPHNATGIGINEQPRPSRHVASCRGVKNFVTKRERRPSCRKRGCIRTRPSMRVTIGRRKNTEFWKGK